jgi:hypothetical protein
MAFEPNIGFGIRVGITPATGVLGVELQRSSGTVGSTAWATIATFQTVGTSTSYDDVLADDNGIRNYRARHTKTGYANGAWSTRVSARPAELF